MADLIRNNLLRSLRKLFAGNPANGLSDADLLARFVHQRDGEAFELLMWRYSALVQNTCWQVLRDEQAVEDAFQATFLVLLRRAKAISRGEALPGWLYSVAHRIALRAREHLVREKSQQEAGLDLTRVLAVPEDTLDAESSRMLHEEVSHLPERYRVPVVCCYLQGQTYAEVAERLGWREGTVAGRLARARDLLRKRLARRGVGLGIGAVAAHLTASACEAATLARRVMLFLRVFRTTATNELTAAGLSAHAAHLAEGVLSQMFWTKLKVVALTMLAAVSLTGVGAVVVARQEGTVADKPPVKAERRVGGEANPPKVAVQPPDTLDEAVRRLRLRRNFRTLALAMHNYNEVNGHLPLPASVSKEGKPLLSWRVAILPFIEEDNLYKQFRLDESWDSPHNKKLIAKMPSIFASGIAGAKPDRTTIQYLVGPEAVFPSQIIRPRPGTPSSPPGGSGSSGAPDLFDLLAPPGGGSSSPPGGGLPSIPASFTDGTSNTLLLVEARAPVVWTKPDDIPYHPKKPIPALGDASSVVFHAAFADGVVRALPQRLDVTTLRALITANGGEIIDPKKFSLDGVSGGSARQDSLGKLKKRNDQIKQETTTLREIMKELKEELLELRWAHQKEELLASDPVAAKLKKETEQSEKELKEAREDARTLVAEIEKLRKALLDKQKK